MKYFFFLKSACKNAQISVNPDVKIVYGYIYIVKASANGRTGIKRELGLTVYFISAHADLCRGVT